MPDFKAPDPSDGSPIRVKWSIAAIRQDVRDKAVKAAEKKRYQVGEWLEEAIEAHLAPSDAGQMADPIRPGSDMDQLSVVERIAASMASLTGDRSRGAGSVRTALSALIPPQLRAPPKVKRIKSGLAQDGER